MFNLFNFKEMMKNFSEFGTPLSRADAKKVVAGSSGMACMVDADCPEGGACLNGVCDGKCVATKTISDFNYICASSAADAAGIAGKDGWWCCNCAEALANC